MKAQKSCLKRDKEPLNYVVKFCYMMALTMPILSVTFTFNPTLQFFDVLAKNFSVVLSKAIYIRLADKSHLDSN